MKKIDRLGWAAGLSLVSYGVRLGVRVSDASVLPRLQRSFPPGWRPSSSRFVDRIYSLCVGGEGPRRGVRRYHVLYQGGVRLARTLALDEALDRLALDMHLSVAARARRRLFVHAGVVGWNGRAVVIPGYTFSGKSTLVAALVDAGATYYSDEYAVLDAKGLVHAFPKPLILRGAHGEPYVQCPAPNAGSVPTPPLPIGLVAAARYRPGGRWRPRRVSPAQGVLVLLAHTVPLRSRPREALSLLRRALGRATVVQTTRGEVEPAARALLRLADR